MAAIAITCAITIAPAQGADQLRGQLIRAYNAGRYQSAEALGEKVIARHPNDYSARYYLANTYVVLHKNEQAIGQYRICLNSGLDGPLKQYSSTALERLLRQKELALMAASQNERAKDLEIKEFQKKIRNETKHEEQRLRNEWNQALSRLNNSYNSGFRRGFGGYRRFGSDDERNRVNELYSRRIAELSDHEASMLSQANCGTGKSRLQPSLSSSKVKNYINYGDESDAAYIPVDNPLHAQARSLDEAQPKVDSKKTAGGRPKPKAGPRHVAAKETKAAASPGQGSP